MVSRSDCHAARLSDVPACGVGDLRDSEHQYPIPEALLYGVQIVGKQTHQISDLVHLKVILREIFAMVKHTVAQIGLHPDRRPVKTDASDFRKTHK